MSLLRFVLDEPPTLAELIVSTSGRIAVKQGVLGEYQELEVPKGGFAELYNPSASRVVGIQVYVERRGPMDEMALMPTVCTKARHITVGPTEGYDVVAPEGARVSIGSYRTLEEAPAWVRDAYGCPGETQGASTAQTAERRAWSFPLLGRLRTMLGRR